MTREGVAGARETPCDAATNGTAAGGRRRTPNACVGARRRLCAIGASATRPVVIGHSGRPAQRLLRAAPPGPGAAPRAPTTSRKSRR